MMAEQNATSLNFSGSNLPTQLVMRKALRGVVVGIYRGGVVIGSVAADGGLFDCFWGLEASSVVVTEFFEVVERNDVDYTGEDGDNGLVGDGNELVDQSSSDLFLSVNGNVLLFLTYLFILKW